MKKAYFGLKAIEEFEMNYVIGLIALIIFYVMFKKFVAFMEEYDTMMSIRKGLIEAKKLHEQRYGFKPRVDQVQVCNGEFVLDFTQFRGRL